MLVKITAILKVQMKWGKNIACNNILEHVQVLVLVSSYQIHQEIGGKVPIVRYCARHCRIRNVSFSVNGPQLEQ